MATIDGATINIAGAGDNVILAGVAGLRLYITGYVIVASAAVSVTFKSSTGVVLAGPMQLAANGGVSYAGTRDAPAFPPLPAGDGFTINLSGAIQTGGHFNYERA